MAKNTSNTTIIKIFCGLLMLVAAGASAQTLQPVPNVYLSAFIDRHKLGVIESTAQLKPVIATASVGYWVFDGVGLELEAGFGLANDSVRNLDVDFGSKLGANLRLESPPVEGFAAYALFGYVRTSYDTNVAGSRSSIALPGGRLAFGMTYAIRPQLLLDAAFSHHDYDSDTRINSFRFGVRYDLGS